MTLPPASLDSLRAKFDAVVQPFDVHPLYKRFATSATHDGSPHVEYDGQTYAYLITERGTEYERRETTDPDKLLYWLISDTTREVAQQHELKHRIPGRDCRRLLFARHVELLESIRPDWAALKRAEYENVLKKFPFTDGA